MKREPVSMIEENRLLLRRRSALGILLNWLLFDMRLIR